MNDMTPNDSDASDEDDEEIDHRLAIEKVA